MASNDFVHLHSHTVYSLLDGLNPIKPLAQRASELGFSALAITDHGRMSGVLEFYREMKKVGVKPIIGCEVYLAHKSALLPASPDNPTNHLLLLCQNQTGYRNLCKLLTIAEKPPYFFMKPRVDLDLLAQYSEGLICSTACIQGPIGRHVCELRVYDRSNRKYVYWDKDIDAAIDYMGRIKEIFPDRCFLEVMDHTSNPKDLIGMDPECRTSYDGAVRMETTLLNHSVHIAQKAGVPMLATNDCHFLSAAMHHAHDVLVQINTRRGTKTTAGKGSKVMRAGLTELYLKDKEAMWRTFGHIPDCLNNTLWVAEQCNVEFEDKSFKIPKFEIPIEIQGHTETPYMHMSRKSLEGAEIRYGNPVPDDVVKQIEFEANTIEKIGVCDYMLIVADFVNWAKNRDILVGPARGSAGGSIVSYCLGITDIDPKRHGLLFERFMNPDRVSMPDIDVDFPPDRMDEVLEYVRNKYGADRCARIATFQSLDTKAAIQRVGADVYGEDHKDLRALTKTLPDKQGDFFSPLSELRKEHPPLVKYIAANPTVRNEMLDVVEQIIGVKQAASAHAAGVLISDKPIENYLPLMVGSAERKKKNFDAMMHTQVPMDDLEDLGLLKMDFLKVDSLATMALAFKYIEETQGVRFRFPPEWEETYDDKETFSIVQQGRTAGVFQIESDGMRRAAMKLQPETFEQLYALIAIHRPGPMDMVDKSTGLTMEDTFIQRKRGWQEVSYLMDGVKPELGPTFGVLVYQEQIMRISQAICGYSPSQADVLRKGVGKKNLELIQKEKKKFIPAGVANGHDPEIVERLWDEIETFARYGFNKSHSVGYGKLTYQTAYMKAHFRQEWMAALLTIKADNDKQVRKYVDECARLSIPVYEPHINQSQAGWVPEGDGVRFGFSSILGISKAAGILVSIRGDGFKTFLGFIDRSHASNKKLKQSDLEVLIRAGCCDHWGKRLTMLAEMKERWKVLDKRKKKPEKAIALFSEKFGDLGEGVDLSKVEKQGEHLRLLSGCYVVEAHTPSNSVLRLVGTTENQEEFVQAVELAQRNPGVVPLVLAFPTEDKKYAWLQVGKVRDTQNLRDELSDLGVTWSMD